MIHAVGSIQAIGGLSDSDDWMLDERSEKNSDYRSSQFLRGLLSYAYFCEMLMDGFRLVV